VTIRAAIAAALLAAAAREPRVEVVARRGGAGAVAWDDVQETYHRGDRLASLAAPVPGAQYLTHRIRYAVLQVRAVHRHRARPVHLVHNAFCTQPAGTAEVPWSCESTVFALDGPHEAEVDGAFERVDLHPARPLFAGITWGCCGGESAVSVHALDGRLLCPAAPLMLEYEDASVWNVLRIEGSTVVCPDGSRAPAGESLAERATRLVHDHAKTLLRSHRLPVAADRRGDWAVWAGRHGDVPIAAAGDFDGDGVEDDALLLPRRQGAGFAVFALLAEGISRRVFILEDDRDSPATGHGLETEREPAAPRDTIVLRGFETTAVRFTWDEAAHRFRRVRLED
jgi:hypothetical protein